MPSSGAVVKCAVFVGLVTLSCFKSVMCVPLQSTMFAKPLVSTTLRDITKAFNTVTNDTKEIRNLIPNMFNLSLGDPTYIFQLPQEGDRRQSVVVMKKSDFMQPIFPNLTKSYIQLMKSKETVAEEDDGDATDQIERNGVLWDQDFVDEDSSTLILNLQTERSFIEYLEKLNRQDEGIPSETPDSSDDWVKLGLDGWKGALSSPQYANRPAFSWNAKQGLSNPSKKTSLKWDLPGKMLEDTLDRNIMQVTMNSSVKSQPKYSITNMRADHSDADVYISRANDPFGHSTKWSMKNSSSIPKEDDRKKRAIVELYSMIKCSTGCDPIVFKGYGCYCGFLGNGLAVDGIDRCCKFHDNCYENSGCISYLQYFVPYLWKCFRGKPLCAVDHGEWGGPNSCAARLCNCDLMLSRCLREYVCPQKRAICRTSKSRMLQNILFNF